MPAVPPSPSVRNCLHASGVRRGRGCAPSQAKTRYYRKGLRVSNARGIATRRVCHRVGSHGRVPYLPRLSTYIRVGFFPRSAGVVRGLQTLGWRVEYLSALSLLACMFRGLQTLGYSCGVASPLLPLAGGVSSALRSWLAWVWCVSACRVRGLQTLGWRVEYLSALSRGVA